MAIRFLEWYNKLPTWERDLPIVFMEGKYWTPNEIYEEVLRNSTRATSLLKMLETIHLQNYLRDLAKTRLLLLLERYPVDVSTFSIDHPEYTAEELKRLVRYDTGFGSVMIDNEIRWIINIVRGLI